MLVCFVHTDRPAQAQSHRCISYPCTHIHTFQNNRQDLLLSVKAAFVLLDDCKDFGLSVVPVTSISNIITLFLLLLYPALLLFNVN